MSEKSEKRVLVICEGVTDYEFLRAVLASINSELVVTLLQPEADALGGDAGRHGGGWKGVRSWCETIANEGGLGEAAALKNSRAIILHVDADIASDRDVNCARPCPPASPTVDALRAFIAGQWLCYQPTDLPSSLVFCIPAQSTELWMWAALYPDEFGAQQNPECLSDPAKKLTHRPEKYVQRKDGSLKKNRRAYQTAAPAIRAAWPAVVQSVPEAARFDQDLRQALNLGQQGAV